MDYVDTTLSSKLAVLYHTDSAIKALFDELAGREKDILETSVQRISTATSQPYYAMSSGMRAVAEAGAGTMRPTIKGRGTRIEWDYSTRGLAAVARGEALLLPASADAIKTEDELDGLVRPTGMVITSIEISHEFMLRPGLKVSFKLPEDLTYREAERLTAFIHALPYEDED